MIKNKLLVTFLIISIIPVVLVCQMVFYKAKVSLRDTVLLGLHAIAEVKEGEVFLYLENLRMRTNDFASDGFIRQQVEKIVVGDLESDALIRASNDYLTKNKKLLDDMLINIDLLDLNGTIIASTESRRIGRNKLKENHFLAGKEGNYVSVPHDYEGELKGLEVSAPIKGRTGKGEVIGVLVNHFSLSDFNEMFSGDLILELGAKTQKKGVGKTGKIYLVNKERVVITESLFGKDEAFHQRVDTYPVEECFEEGREVAGSWLDYRGISVVGASMCISVNGFQVTLLSEQDAAEALAPVEDLKKLSLILVFVIMFFIGWFAFQIAHLIADPIKKLQKSAEIIGSGNLDHKVEGVESRDEIGQLARTFNQMTDNLKEMVASHDELNEEIVMRKQSEEKFRRFMDTAPDAIVIANEEGKIELVNKQTEVLFGYPRDELVGRFVECLIPKRFQNGHPRHRKDYITRPEVKLMAARNTNLAARRKDGSEFPVEINLSPLETEQGRLVTAAIRDITDRKHAEQVIIQKSEELERSNQELEQFAYIASHDLQEPLRKVKTFGDRLAQKYGEVLGSQGQDYLKRMGNAASRMQILINDLLTYSRVISKAQPFTAVNLNDIVHDVLSDLEIKIEETNAQIHVDDLPAIEADSLQMRQLFQNLIGNALKFSRPEISPIIEIKSTLKLSQGEDAGEAALGNNHVCVISVADNGIGFEEKYSERIFHVFQRLHGRNEYAGTGIGLAVCRKIVACQGGSIETKSVPGKGSTFIITLPVKQPNEEKGEV